MITKLIAKFQHWMVERAIRFHASRGLDYMVINLGKAYLIIDELKAKNYRVLLNHNRKQLIIEWDNTRFDVNTTKAIRL